MTKEADDNLPMFTPEAVEGAAAVFEGALGTLKDVDLGRIVPEGLSETQRQLVMAEILEKGGSDGQAAALYQAVLDSSVTGELLPGRLESVLGEALSTVEGIARLDKPSTKAAFERYLELCNRMVSSQEIFKVACRAVLGDEISNDDWERALAEFMVVLEAATADSEVDESELTEAELTRRDVMVDIINWGVQPLSDAAAKGLAEGAVIAHRLDESELSQRFIDEALIAAQIGLMPQLEVMRGERVFEDPPLYDEDSALQVALALFKLGRLKESAAMALYTEDPEDDSILESSSESKRPHARERIELVTVVVPEIFRLQPRDPETINLVERFVHLSNYVEHNEEKKRVRDNLSVMKALAAIAAGLDTAYNLGRLPGGAADILTLGRGSDESEAAE